MVYEFKKLEEGGYVDEESSEFINFTGCRSLFL